MSTMVVSLSKRIRVPVASYKEARDAVVAARGDVGASEWYERGAGRIYVDGKQVAFVSYNGRVWEGTGQGSKEILP
jgi:hypothetical protein